MQRLPTHERRKPTDVARGMTEAISEVENLEIVRTISTDMVDWELSVKRWR